MERGINRHTLLGVVASAPELRTLPAGGRSVRFRVLTVDRWVDRLTGAVHQRRDWHLITAWDSLAERIHDEVQEGSVVHLEGPVRSRKWTDANNQVRYVTETHAMELIVVTTPTEHVATGTPSREGVVSGGSSELPRGLLETPVVRG